MQPKKLKKMIKSHNISTHLLILLFLSTAALSCNSNKKENSFIETPSGLKYKILKEGNGESAKVGQKYLYTKQCHI